MRTPGNPAISAALLTIACAVVIAPIAGAAPDYRSDQMDDLAESGARMVTDYLIGIGVSAASLPEMIFIPSGAGVDSQCIDVTGDNNQDDRAWNYCPTDNHVYIGQNTLWDSYRQYGSTGPLSGLAHEYGHYLQSVMGVPKPNTASDTIGNENQADCISGAFLGYLRDRAEGSPAQDLGSVEQYLTATASVEAPGRDHGTAAERIESFELGYAGALPACSRFYPATPLTA